MAFAAAWLALGSAAVSADDFCARQSAYTRKPLSEYLAYYRSVAASKADEAVYARAEKDFLTSSVWLKSQMGNPELLQNSCDPKMRKDGDLLALLAADLEFRHDRSWMHAAALRAQTAILISLRRYVVQDPTLGLPLYRFLVRGARDAFAAGKIPLPDGLRRGV